ncbi:acetyl-CoA acetyltransferase [Sphingobium sp. CR2-8]|uniref:acetyl-CoA acetyltransferase n=1 Tax=Sphingobium sp. CR2-8 TaxID=1306534 RepID=UPI002DBFF303|nr:acetyl-CoA acetyltransferase [Sphingobium sp. CR2-8]MEC3909530.1 acetyl-CoA acetyltransferase [Sphingobium sp. CR2-8]
MIAKALQNADADAGGGWLEKLDSVDLVALTSWRYTNPVGDICAKVGIAPALATNSRRGGETPVRLLHEAALEVVRGEHRACAIVGGEATNARAQARKSGAKLPWSDMAPSDQSAQFAGLSTVRSPLAERYAMLDPASIYPLYETASHAAWDLSPAQAHDESAKLWALYAQAAGDNPSAWMETPPSAETIGTIGPDNRLINWPYPKLMVANPSVNQASAFIVTTLAHARNAGIPEDKLVYILGGAAANEPANFLDRDRYDRSTAQEAVLSAALAQVGGVEELTFMELYSCFPIVPKMALRFMGIEQDQAAPSVTGGLTFFGGPLHNYMSHAICAMVRALRAHPHSSGLLYGQGGYVTKHHALLLGSDAPQDTLAADWSVQAEADRNRGPSPQVREDYAGPATLEAFTVRHSRDGEPDQGIVVVRTPAGERTLARVPGHYRETIDLLEAWDRSPVGTDGMITLCDDGDAVWQPLATTPLSIRRLEA